MTFQEFQATGRDVSDLGTIEPDFFVTGTIAEHNIVWLVICLFSIQLIGNDGMVL